MVVFLLKEDGMLVVVLTVVVAMAENLCLCGLCVVWWV
jgi:hypothetical protein